MYDYVIVGAGSAGCVLAARLGEDRDVRVAVIEAGPPDGEPVIHMALAFRQLWESRFDWGLWSEREPGLHDRRDLLDGWAAMGCAGWGHADVPPYLRRGEQRARRKLLPRRRWAAQRERRPFAASAGRGVHRGGGRRRHRPDDDHNGPTQEGAGWFR
jgi:choline dehydrogenase